MGNLALSWALLRVRIATIGFGPKDGASHLLALLPNVEDFPNPNVWRPTAQQASRPGAGRKLSDESRRARAAGSYAVWRSFRNEEDRQTFWMLLIPYASETDAVTRLVHVPDDLLHKPFWKLIEQYTDRGDPIVGADRSIRYRERSKHSSGRESATTIAAGTIGEMLFVMDFSAGGGAEWPTASVDTIISKQVHKLKSVLTP